MTRLVIYRAAAPGDRFDSHAFDRAINQPCPYTLKETDDGPVIAHLGEAILVAAEVAEDGSGVTLTVEVPDLGPPPSAGGMSFSFSPPPEVPERWWE